MASVNVERFSELAEAWDQMVASGVAWSSHRFDPTRWAAAIEGMLVVQRGLAAEGRWSAGPASLMEVLEIERNEVANCRVVRWLLDPIARHGIGSTLLVELAREVEFDIEDTTACKVETEVSRNEADGKAVGNESTRATTRADIVVTSVDGNVLVIEAKIDAGEQPEQAARLERNWPEADRFVFLTTEGTRMPRTQTDAARWRPLAWHWFAEQALHLIDSQPASDPVVALSHASIRSWAHTIRRHYR